METTALTAQEHTERINRELREAGVSRFTLRKFTTHYLPKVIHADEHIEAAVYGRHKETEGIFGFIEGALIATDKRVIYLNHQPGYTTMDEVGYENVSGINFSRAGIYAGITLFTKIANYTLSFTTPRCAKQFAEYIENRITHKLEEAPIPNAKFRATLSSEAISFLRNHELGILSSTERSGSVSGAAVYYTVYGECPYFMTRTATRKAWNILGNQHVALTIVDEQARQTLQLQGVVETEKDELAKAEVAQKIIRARAYRDGNHLPPIMKLDGEFVTFRIRPTRFNFTDYSKLS